MRKKTYCGPNKQGEMFGEGTCLYRSKDLYKSYTKLRGEKKKKKTLVSVI